MTPNDHVAVGLLISSGTNRLLVLFLGAFNRCLRALLVLAGLGARVVPTLPCPLLIRVILGR